MLLDLNNEIIVDLFAGGGGASCGIEMGLGRMVDFAVNHDRAAVDLHELNHPTTKHFHADVFEVDPRDVARDRPIGLLWGSPDCTYHSKARGAKPIRHANRKRRALAWVINRWQGQVRPRVIMMENVEEFSKWCPLVAKRDPETGRVLRNDEAVAAGAPRVAAPGERVPVQDQQLVPDARRAGETYRTFVRQMVALGYQVETRELRACDFGAPTIRKRWFLIARCDRRPIVWPAPTHGDPESAAVKAGTLRPWRTAAECIDWTIPMLSIFATKEEAKAWGKAHGRNAPKRPLAEATMRRVARGVWRYVVNAARPFFVPLTHHGERAGHSFDRPAPTITGAHRGELAVVAPVLTEHANASAQRVFAADEPMRTQCADVKGGHFALIAGVGGRAGDSPERPVEVPFQTITAKADSVLIAPVVVPNNTNNAAHGLEEPVPTVTGGNRNILASAVLVDSAHGEVSPGGVKRWGTGARAAAQPMGTITGTGNPMLAAPVLVPRYGERDGQAPRARSAEEPMPVIVPTGNGASLVAAHAMSYHADKRPGDVRGSGLGEPLDTVDTSNRHAVVAAFLGQNNSGGYTGDGRPADLPASTILNSGSHQAVIGASLVKLRGTSSAADPADPLHTCSAGGTHHGVVAAHVQRDFGASVGHPADRPLGTVTGGGNAALVATFLQSYYGTDQDPRLDEPLPTATTKARFGLVTVMVAGVLMVIVDICMRMFAPRELARAQGFPDSYVIERIKDRALTLEEQVRMIGNSVPPQFAMAMARANVPELIVRTVPAPAFKPRPPRKRAARRASAAQVSL